MTLTQAATLLGLAPATLRGQIARGHLRATKVGRDWTVTPAEVKRYRQESLGARKPSMAALMRAVVDAAVAYIDADPESDEDALAYDRLGMAVKAYRDA